jgi:nitrous oxide reductase accessory protein NosL
MANKSVNNVMTQWTITLEEDPETGDCILPFPEDLLEQAGWKEGDTLNWIDNKDGTWCLEKVSNG